MKASTWWTAAAVTLLLGAVAVAFQSQPADAGLHERYAAARLRLAELRLERAEELNRQTPGLLTETDMRRLRQRVAFLQAEVAATKDHPHGNALDAQVAAAKAMARIAEEDLRAATAAHKRQPKTVSAIDLRQFEVKAEIANLRVALWEDPSFRNSSMEVVQMQIDQISDLLHDVVAAIDSAPAINRR